MDEGLLVFLVDLVSVGAGCISVLERARWRCWGGRGSPGCLISGAVSRVDLKLTIIVRGSSY